MRFRRREKKSCSKIGCVKKIRVVTRGMKTEKTTSMETARILQAPSLPLSRSSPLISEIISEISENCIVPLGFLSRYS